LLHERIRELAIVEERERIARELHDGLAQVLGYVNTKAFAIRRLLINGDSRAAEAMLAQLEEAAREVYSDVREGVLALRTASPEDGSLDEGICAYAAQFEQMTGIEVRCEVADGADLRRLPEMTDLQVLRIVQEALSNVRKHAEAGSVTIRMVVRGATLRIAVIDDGCGFETEGIGSADSQQFGLRTMRERAEAIGGTLKVLSRRGEGTTVTVEVPVETWVGVEL
jgi:signal transduction histidine kinase